MYKSDIATQALFRLGSSISIIDLDNERSAEARVIRSVFDRMCDSLMSFYDWNWARGYTPLSLISDDSNVAGYKYMYQYPPDILKIRNIARDGQFPKIVLREEHRPKFEEIYSGLGKTIITDVPNAHAEVTVKVPKSISFPIYYGEALAAQIALRVGPQLITSNWPRVMASITRGAETEVEMAIAQDLSNQTSKRPEASPLIQARWG